MCWNCHFPNSQPGSYRVYFIMQSLDLSAFLLLHFSTTLCSLHAYSPFFFYLKACLNVFLRDWIAILETMWLQSPSERWLYKERQVSHPNPQPLCCPRNSYSQPLKFPWCSVLVWCDWRTISELCIELYVIRLNKIAESLWGTALVQFIFTFCVSHMK